MNYLFYLHFHMRLKWVKLYQNTFKQEFQISQKTQHFFFFRFDDNTCPSIYHEV